MPILNRTAVGADRRRLAARDTQESYVRTSDNVSASRTAWPPFGWTPLVGAWEHAPAGRRLGNSCRTYPDLL